MIDEFEERLNFTLLDSAIHDLRELVSSHRKAHSLPCAPVLELIRLLLMRYKFLVRPEDFDEAVALSHEFVSISPQEVKNDVSSFGVRLFPVLFV